MRAVDLVNIGLESESGTPLVLLREQDEPHRLLPVFIGGPEAASIALALQGSAPPRPLTHDLLVTLIEGLDARLDRVEVTGFDDDTFVADLVLAGPGGDRRIDSRPSDAIAAAVRTNAPLFVSDEVLDRAGATLTEEILDDAAIDAEVDEFRDFLGSVEPDDFATVEALPPAGDDADEAEPEADDPEPDEPAPDDPEPDEPAPDDPEPDEPAPDDAEPEPDDPGPSDPELD